jgi:hypothetical protein
MSTFTPAGEQQAGVDAFTIGGIVVVHAGAGTGKTSTRRLLSAVRPSTKGHYPAWNKATQTEAERSFPAMSLPDGPQPRPPLLRRTHERLG